MSAEPHRARVSIDVVGAVPVFPDMDRSRWQMLDHSYNRICSVNIDVISDQSHEHTKT